MMTKAEAEIAALVSDYSDAEDLDLYLFSASVSRSTAERMIDVVASRSDRRPRAALFLTTYGGDPDAAFRIIRVLQRVHTHIRVLVGGMCKSAGTLIALGADELAFGHHGELGPLDVQMVRPDELLQISSGLDIFQSLSALSVRAYQTFEEAFLAITTSSGGNISARLAADIASRISTGLYSPVMGQIDPLRLGEVQRAIDVASAYGKRLRTTNLQNSERCLTDLVLGYPSHSFVIDEEEAAKLFVNVRHFSEREGRIALALRHEVRWEAGGPGLILDLRSTFPRETDTGDSDEAARTDAEPGEPDKGDAAPVPTERADVGGDGRTRSGNRRVPRRPQASQPGAKTDESVS